MFWILQRLISRIELYNCIESVNVSNEYKFLSIVVSKLKYYLGNVLEFCSEWICLKNFPLIFSTFFTHIINGYSECGTCLFGIYRMNPTKLYYLIEHAMINNSLTFRMKYEVYDSNRRFISKGCRFRTPYILSHYQYFDLFRIKRLVDVLLICLSLNNTGDWIRRTWQIREQIVVHFIKFWHSDYAYMHSCNVRWKSIFFLAKSSLCVSKSSITLLPY